MRLLKVRAVRLGNSGLKVSKIILGCMSYGSPGGYFAMYLLNSGRSRSAEWQAWVLPEEEGIKHIKAAYDAGINTFDTANVSILTEVVCALDADGGCRSTATGCRRSF